MPVRLRRNLRPTSEGLVFLLMTFGVGLAAVNTGNNLLYLVLGLMLSLVVLSGMLSDFVLWGVRATRRLPRRAFVGAPCLVEIELENVKPWLPSFSLAAGDVLEGEDLRTRLRSLTDADRATYYLKVDPKSSQRAGYLRVPTERGRLRWRHLRLSTRYPFGFFDKWRLLDVVDELLVYPAIVPVPDLERRLESLLGRETARHEAERRARALGTEIAGLRPHRDGDEARAIHWRRSAALGALVVRELERDPGREIAIRLDPGDTVGLEAQARLERMISRAASIAILAHERGAHVELLAPGVRSPRVAPEAPIDPILSLLALLSPRAGEAVPSPRRDASVLDVTDRALDEAGARDDRASHDRSTP
ncbi:MAG: DUF58 domain-containing protein [Sandaracinus sp.]